MDFPAPMALTRGECLAGLAASTIGRVGVTAGALPAVLPVSFVLSGDRVVFRTRRDGLLARACNGSVVAFEVDQIARDGAQGWSVLVVGVANLLHGSEVLRALELNLASPDGADRTQFVAISLGQISGRRVGPTVTEREGRADRASAD